MNRRCDRREYLRVFLACVLMGPFALASVANALPTHAATAPGVILPLAYSGDGSMDHATGGTPHVVRWVGHFHPSMTVFPLGMLLGAALAELLRMLKGPQWLDGASRWCVIVGAIGAL